MALSSSTMDRSNRKFAAGSRPGTVKDPSLHKLPPHSIEAEESILSAILLDNNKLFDIIDIISSEDFYRSTHQIIFEAASELFNQHEAADLVTVTNRLREKGKLEQIGGATYMAKLVNTVPLAANVEQYARIIRDKSSLRKLIEKANTIVNRCYEEQGNAEELIDFAETSIFEISDTETSKSYYPISELLSANIDTLEERQGNKSALTGVPSGFSMLDTLTSGFQKSDLIIVAARPAMGKTSLALNIARNAAVDSNIPVAVFSLEMSKEQLSLRLLTSEARLNSARLRSGFFSNDDWVRLTGAADVLQHAPIFIDDSPNVSPMDIRAKARRIKKEKDLGLIIIDYLQLMRTSIHNERRDLEISEISRSLKILAKELSIPIIALSQLNRMLEQRSDKRPMLSDLRESGALEQDADVVAFIYRDEIYNKNEDNVNKGKAEIILGKQRNGPTGTAHLAFLDTYTRFENLAPTSFSDGG